MMKLLYRREDGTFVAEIDGLPYHILPGDDRYWGEAVAEAVRMGSGLKFEPKSILPGSANSVDIYRLSIQTLIDTKAKERQYDSGATLASYVNSTVPEWAAEAQAFVAWRDQVWSYALAELDKVKTGQREQPTVEDFLAELPAFEWPSELVANA